MLEDTRNPNELRYIFNPLNTLVYSTCQRSLRICSKYDLIMINLNARKVHFVALIIYIN